MAFVDVPGIRKVDGTQVNPRVEDGHGATEGNRSWGYITVVDDDGNVLEGRLPANVSHPTVLSDEDFAKLEAIRVAAAGALTDTQLAARLNTLGQKDSANSAPVALSTEQQALLTALIGQTPTSNRDTGNQRSGAMTASEVFDGTWKEIEDHGGIFVRYLSSHAPTAGEANTRIEFSDDGSTHNGVSFGIQQKTSGAFFIGTATVNSINIGGKYYRVHYKNGATPSTFTFIFAQTAKFPDNGFVGALDATLSLLNQALLTRAVVAGFLPSGTPGNVGLTEQGDLRVGQQAVIDPNNTVAAAPVAAYLGTPYLDEANLSQYYGAPPPAAPADTWVATDWTPAANYAAMSLDAFASVLGHGYAIWSVDGTNVSRIESTLFGGAGAFTDPPQGARFLKIAFQNRSAAPGIFSVDTQLRYTPQSLFLFPAGAAGSVGVSPTFPTAMMAGITLQQDPDSVENPSLPFHAQRGQGVHSANSTHTPLSGSETWFGKWFRWQRDYVGLVVEALSNVPGELHIEFSAEETPIDFTDDSVTDSRIYAYPGPFTPLNATMKRHIPIQSKWVRLKWVNGPTAQDILSVDTAFVVSPTTEENAPAYSIPLDSEMSGQERVNIHAKDSGSTTGFIGRGGAGSGLDSHITGHSVETPIRPLNSLRTGQGTITSATAVPVPSAGAGLTNRKSIEYSNHSNTVNLYWSESANKVANNQGKILRPGGDVVMEIDESVNVFWIAEDTGGTTSTSRQSGSSGTAGSLTSNDTRTSLASVAASAAVTGFNYTQVQPELQVIRIGFEGRKQSGQFETVALQQSVHAVQSGGTYTSPSLAGGMNQLYVVSIARNTTTGTITTVAVAGGPTFVAAQQNASNGSDRLDVWYAYGNFPAGVVTAGLSVGTNGEISVQRYSLANGTTPIVTATPTTGTGTDVTGPAVAGMNKGFAALIIAHNGGATGSPGAGYTERTDLTDGTGGNTVSLWVGTKPLVTTGSEVGTATIGSSAWVAVGIAIQPSPALDPVVTLHYDLGGPDGDTTVNIPLSNLTDEDFFLDITLDENWTETLVNSLEVKVTVASIGAAAAEIDHIFVEPTEGSEDSAARLSFAEVADLDY